MEANRFRFRAWNGEHMTDPFDFSGLSDGYLEGERLSAYTFMQSTGLTDKAGREIYEGDILTWDGFTRAVRWDENVAAWQFAPYMGVVVSVAMHNHRAEIIGNIYENPELLKAK